MTPMSIAKVALALMAAILFAYGARNDMPQLRWAAIAFLAVAVVLRFFDRTRSRK